MLAKQNSRKTWLLSISFVFVLLASAVGTVSAAEFPKGETISADETIDDDVFISGNNVVVDGTVNGILIATGQTVTVNGTINGDAILAGETIVVSDSAVIDGNLFVGAADVTVDGDVTGTTLGGSAAMVLGSGAEVGRNFFYGGFSLITETDSVVGRDLYAGSYQSLLSGSVARDLKVGAGAVELNGNIGRNAVLEIGDVDSPEESMEWMQFNPYLSQYVDEFVQPGIRVSENASINGNVTYISPIDRTSAIEGVAAGTIVYQTPVPAEGTAGISYSADQVQPFNRTFPNVLVHASLLKAARNFIKLMAVGALILWLLRKSFMKIVESAYKDPLKSIGWGFIVIAAGFLAALIIPLVYVMVGVIIGFVSLGSLLYVWFGLVGMTLLLTSALFFFAVFTLSKVIASYMFGKWIMKAVFKEEKDKVWLNLLVGVFLFIIIRAIPFIGWLAGLTAVLIGSGAFWLAATAKKD